MTDRAKRYRAQRNKPNGPRRCNFCASRKNVDIDHIEGDEDDGAPENLMYLCRPCNTRKGIIQARHRIGRRTEQYNPESGAARAARSLKEWKAASEIVLGYTPGSVRLATAILRNTSPAKRKIFGDQLERNPAPTFAQYAYGVSIHQRKAHDEGGAIIHSTPPALRHQYAQQIAALKKKHGTGRHSDVPF